MTNVSNLWLRELSLFMGGVDSANDGGHKFQCKQIEGGRISVRGRRGGGDFECVGFSDLHCHPIRE